MRIGGESGGDRALDDPFISVYTLIKSFEWDDGKAKRNALKHGIDFEAAAFTFDDPNALILEDARHSGQEPRHRLLGDSGAGVLVVVFTVRGVSLRIISARRANRRERRFYGQSKGV